MDMEMDTPLHGLAHHMGILPGYTDQKGNWFPTSDASYMALLATLGYPVRNYREAALTLAHLRSIPQPMVAPCQVASPATARLPVSWAFTHRRVPWKLTLQEETGAVHTFEGVGTRRRGYLPLPNTLPWGYHRLRLETGGTLNQVADQQLIITPERCVVPQDVMGSQQALGIWTNLYTLRTPHNWGFGDLTDLHRLIEGAAQRGADFIGLNPLHALHNRGLDISPYSPISRLFRNILYLDVEAIEVCQSDPAIQAWLHASPLIERIKHLQQADRIVYDHILELKREALQRVHESFVRHHLQPSHTSEPSAYGHAYQAYLQKHGVPLQQFALFCALSDHEAAQGFSRNWQSWPEGYHDPQGSCVQAFAREHPQAVDFYCYVQFELDRQMRQAADKAKQASMKIGLYQDLAIGSAVGGFDTWAFPSLFNTRASIGAPPDPYALQGQNWGLPPWHPHHISDHGYGYFRCLLQNAFAYSGALRLDHVMGLTRLFCIPHGHPTSQGGYISYPRHDLLGILALESQRHNALVIGEDLGTVPRELPLLLSKWGVLSSKVLYFEKTPKMQFRPAAQYIRRALVTVNTHDHPPVAGFWAHRDLKLRRQVGHIASDAEFKQAQAERQASCQALLACLQQEGYLDPQLTCVSMEDHLDQLIDAVHRFLCHTPAALVGLSLDDVAMETEPVNLPGVSPDLYPSWQRRMSHTLEELLLKLQPLRPSFPTPSQAAFCANSSIKPPTTSCKF